jgi:hypothetical protein
MKDEDALAGLLAVLFLAAIVIYGYILWAIVWFIVSAIVGYIAYQRYVREAEGEFDEMVEELGVGLPADDILASMGIEVPENGGFESSVDWFVGTPLGVTGEWED